MQHFSCVAEAGLWFMFAVTKMYLFVLTGKLFLLNSGNVISWVVLVRFLVSVGICKKTFHKSKFLFWDHGIWIAFWGPWCSQHLLVVCLKFQFGPALGSDKRGRAWCYTKGGCLAWNLEPSLVAGSCALSLSSMRGRTHILGASGLQAAQMSRLLLVSEVSKRFVSFLSQDAYNSIIFDWGGAGGLIKSW